MKIRKMDIYKEAAERLNAKGVKPFSAREFSMPLVQQVMYGKIVNEDVTEEVKQIMFERLKDGTR
jgi:hypothetical protein